MDPRGRRSPYKAQSYVVQLSDPRPSGHRGPLLLYVATTTQVVTVVLVVERVEEGHTLLV
jgi:hypothetical protein